MFILTMLDFLYSFIYCNQIINGLRHFYSYNKSYNSLGELTKLFICYFTNGSRIGLTHYIDYHFGIPNVNLIIAYYLDKNISFVHDYKGYNKLKYVSSESKYTEGNKYRPLELRCLHKYFENPINACKIENTRKFNMLMLREKTSGMYKTNVFANSNISQINYIKYMMYGLVIDRYYNENISRCYSLYNREFYGLGISFIRQHRILHEIKIKNLHITAYYPPINNLIIDIEINNKLVVRN